MPFARLTIADQGLSTETQRELVTAIGALLEKDLLKGPESIVVQVELVPADGWYVRSERHPGTTGARLEVDITAGTNGAAEKAAFMANAYALLGDTLGALPPVTYVALRELDGESYGYNGLSQRERKRAAHAS